MKKNSLIVSVIMPVYNAELYLKDAIDSILNQTFINFEFLIINDGSTDKSKEIILSYNDKRIRYFENQKNLKLIKTLNKGLSLAKGKYIIRMDADDISFLDRFEKQVTFMENNPNIGLCGSNAQAIGSSSNIFKCPSTHSEIINAFIIKSPFIHPSVIMRNSVIIKNNLHYDENYIHAEDYKLWLEFIKLTDVSNMPEILLKYRISETQITNKYAKEQAVTSQKIRREFIKEYKQYDINDIITIHDIKLLKGLNNNDTLTKSIVYCMFLSLDKYNIKSLLSFLLSFDYFQYPYSIKEFSRLILKHLKPKKYYKWL